MVRVAGLKGMVAAGITTASDDGLTPAQQLSAINEEASRLTTEQQAAMRTLRDALKDAGFHLVDGSDLDADDLAWLANTFIVQVHPVLTQPAVDQAQTFPFVTTTGLS